MPEYMLNNHELLSGAGSNFQEIIKSQSEPWYYIACGLGSIIFAVCLLSPMFPKINIIERDSPLERYLVVQKKEKIALKKDWMGTGKINLIKILLGLILNSPMTIQMMIFQTISGTLKMHDSQRKSSTSLNYGPQQ